MVIEFGNYCDKQRKRITRTLIRKIQKMGTVLNLEKWDTQICFFDWEKDYGEYKGGWHEWGKDGSFLFIQVAPSWMVPHVMLHWLVAHEMRHIHQSQYDMFNEKETHLKIIDACLKQDGLEEPNQAFMRKWHDTFPEEVDADTWANTYTGFNGGEWWGDVIQAKTRKIAKSRKVSDYKI